MTKTIPEVILLKYLLIYNNYIKYYKYININKELKELVILYRTLRVLQEKIPESDKSVEDLSAMVWMSYPQMRETEREAISDLLHQLSEVVATPDVVHEVLETVRQRGVARDMAIKALQVSEGAGSIEELSSLATELEEGKDATKPASRLRFVTHDLSEIENHAIRSGGLQWRLNCLRESLGPLRPGDFGFVFARPESGKTTFLASEVSYMAKQLIDQKKEAPILWFNNEEQGEKVRLRVFQAVLGCTADELWRDKEASQRRYSELGGDLIRIVDEPAIYRQHVEQALEEIQPSLVIFDQIDKMKGFDADRNDLVYGKIYQWARELSKSFCPVIGVCQSDGTGEGVKWLTMSHVADAKTAKQAEADWILGIGKSNEVSTEDIRFFNISKNKLLGDAETDPNQRHGRYEVYIRPMIARYEDLE